jgi:hypothetical protein
MQAAARAPPPLPTATSPVFADPPTGLRHRLDIARAAARESGVELVDWIMCDDTEMRSMRITLDEDDYQWHDPDPGRPTAAPPRQMNGGNRSLHRPYGRHRNWGGRGGANLTRRNRLSVHHRMSRIRHRGSPVVGHTDTEGISALEVLSLRLVAAGDVVYSRLHMYPWWRDRAVASPR